MGALEPAKNMRESGLAADLDLGQSLLTSHRHILGKLTIIWSEDKIMRLL
jgi:hypothetical protein